jgi:hypothetical protein
MVLATTGKRFTGTHNIIFFTVNTVGKGYAPTQKNEPNDFEKASMPPISSV